MTSFARARLNLQDVLEDYAVTADGPDHATLTQWTKRYPQYERELTEFAVAWSRMKHLPAAVRGEGAR